MGEAHRMMVESSTERLCCTHCLGIYRTTFERCPRDGGALQPLVGDPLQGSTFADRYIIEECVGEGAMGRVYRARHVNMSRRFAIKILFGELAADETMRNRFAAEAEAASRLDHPNVISVVDFGATETGLLYLVMDFVDGVNLGALIDRDAPLATRRTVALVRRMCRGLQHAHEKGLVHRDFKPDNVIVVDANGTELPKIVDFGLARLPEAQQVNSRFTADGTVVGSPPYMAPEHLQDKPIDHRCDLFSLGIVFYEMLAGRTPFSGTPFEIAHHNVQSPIPPIAKRTPGVAVAPEIEAIVIRLLQKQPEDRIASAAEVVEELDRVMPRERTRASPTTGPPLFDGAESEGYKTPPPIITPPRRPATYTEIIEAAPKRGPLLPILGALLVAAGGIVIYALQSRGGGEESAQTGAPPATESPAQPAVAQAPPDASPERALPPDAGIPTERLARAQSAVVEATDSLERSHGPDAAAPFRARYATIRYDEALGDVSLRPDVIAELEELGREITAAQEAAPPKKVSKKSSRKKRRKVERGGVIDAFGDD